MIFLAIKGAANIDFDPPSTGTVNLQKYGPKIVQGPFKMVFGCPCKWALENFFNLVVNCQLFETVL